MSLLLDARKKSQQARSAQGADEAHSKFELSLEEHTNKMSAPDISPGATMPDDTARSAGKNLFHAKSPAIKYSRMGGINRNLLLALSATVLLLTAGAGYLWYIGSFGDAPPIRPPLPAAAVPPVSPAPIAVAPDNRPTAEPTVAVASGSAARTPRATKTVRRKTGSPPKSDRRISIQPKQTELLDPLIKSAYLAYRGGKLNEAMQMYLEVNAKDARNADALLGLAAIAQLKGEDRLATQYYLRVLTLDPRNAVAHAGMSALNKDENSESRLKSLLHEQRDSAALHFALGNIYAGQSRWGEAQSAYFNAFTLDSKNSELAFNLAVSLDHLGQNKLAVEFYQRALQLDSAGSNQPHSASLDHAKISQRMKELAR